jgi:hypothetical protein
VADELLEEDKCGLFANPASGFVTFGDQAIKAYLLSYTGLLKGGTLQEDGTTLPTKRMELARELIGVTIREDHDAERFRQHRHELSGEVSRLPTQLDASTGSAVVDEPCYGLPGGLYILGVFQIENARFPSPTGSNSEGGVNQRGGRKDDHLKHAACHHTMASSVDTAAD